MKTITKRLIGAMMAFSISLPALSAGLIRDAEIERTLKIVSAPLLKNAGLSSRTNVLVVNDNSLNAFVTGGNAIFLHSGLIRRLKDKEMLQAVLAHEFAHITNGHVAQRRQNFGNAKTAVGLGILLAVAAAASGNSQSGIPLAIGALDATRKSTLSFTRAQEASADKSGARLLARSGIDPEAAVRVLDIFRGQELLNIERSDPYARSHPLSADRVAKLKVYADLFEVVPAKNSKTMDYWYGRMVAKFDGFIGSPGSILRKTRGDKTEFGTLRRAIALHRSPKPKASIKEINKLIKLRPNDAFYHELKGQFLLESGNAKGAVKSYRKAAQLAPQEALILSGLGRSLIAENSKSSNAEALRVLKNAYSKDSRDRQMLRSLGLAFSRAGQNGMASLMTAESYAIASDLKLAKVHATRALGLLPKGTSGWLKANDIVATANRFTKGKKKK